MISIIILGGISMPMSSSRSSTPFRCQPQNGRWEAVLGCKVEVLTKGLLSPDPRGSARMPNNSSAMVTLEKNSVSGPWASSQSRTDGCGSDFIARRPDSYRAGSFEAHRLSETRVAAMFKCLDIGIGEADLLGTHGGLQNGAHFRFRAAIVLRRADFPLVGSTILKRDRAARPGPRR
ncbi:hypothetical protein IVB45_06725 [Bradyrhizobium sp. 4]|nr:hypothetical protein [Bradyrhizobium sp. 39]MCK1406037.1 hypothetical protein [Bradyrhizobium sp. 76]MCK1750226.1 hypothetical protein [Bradyrhizobium sp. 135]UPJ36547.1 hypothetical protein IVB45_06725 [Bradyrhizobium sp. 4]UPJ60067.1 hypothetical protein IVB24_10645 [Bradyrhizobium sp. 192]